MATVEGESQYRSIIYGFNCVGKPLAFADGYGAPLN